jgi:hypothetical protein
MDRLLNFFIRVGKVSVYFASLSEGWLTGKTKKAVINLLFEDVKSLIKDSGIQYSIYSDLSLYKQIP